MRTLMVTIVNTLSSFDIAIDLTLIAITMPLSLATPLRHFHNVFLFQIDANIFRH